MLAKARCVILERNGCYCFFSDSDVLLFDLLSMKEMHKEALFLLCIFS